MLPTGPLKNSERVSISFTFSHLKESVKRSFILSSFRDPALLTPLTR